MVGSWSSWGGLGRRAGSAGWGMGGRSGDGAVAGAPFQLAGAKPLRGRASSSGVTFSVTTTANRRRIDVPVTRKQLTTHGAEGGSTAAGRVLRRSEPDGGGSGGGPGRSERQRLWRQGTDAPRD